MSKPLSKTDLLLAQAGRMQLNQPDKNSTSQQQWRYASLPWWRISHTCFSVVGVSNAAH
jgi:hypothetical protein